MSVSHPVVVFPGPYDVLDLTVAAAFPRTSEWSVGRYDEDRAIYTQALFAGARTVHMGIDLGGPAGTPVHAWTDGVVIHAGYNAADGDYGHVLVLEHDAPAGLARFALYGHLSAATLAHAPVGRRFAEGDAIGWLGAPSENGGWPPHVHLQLARDRPATHDLPGAVSLADRAWALQAFPDPRTVLGPVY
ncbi:MAG: murein DD-endopeptidase MepM/ murein hydrolase activator NlpD [Myxococcota bacterium]